VQHTLHPLGVPRLMETSFVETKNLARHWLVVLIAIIILFSVPAPAIAQQEQPVSDDDVNEIAKQLYCPVCENIPLDVCGTQACAQWRDLIREKLDQGWNEEEIKVYFVQQYGDRVLAEPPRRGFNWLVYVIPPLAFLLGVFILAKALRNWKTSPDPGLSEEVSTLADEPQADDYLARMEDELRRSQE